MVPQATINYVIGNQKLKVFNVENLIQASYLLLGLLLTAVVLLSIHFRGASNYNSSREYQVFQDRDQQLAAIRKFVTQGTTSLRDYLINNNPNSTEVYDEEIRRAKLSTTKAFLGLHDWVSQSFVLSEMDRDLADYWAFLDQNRPVVPEEKQARGYALVREQVLPGRREVFNSVKLLEDRNALDRAEMVNRYATQRRNDLIAIFAVMGSIILISLLLASGHQKFRRDFQAESRQKFRDMAQARDSLEQLSGRLLRIQEDERRKISRELHDGIGQTLTALRMEIHQVHFSAIHGLNGGEERLLRARQLAEEAVRTCKDISLLLRPPLLDDLGLEPALAWLAEQFHRRTEIRCRFRAINLQELLPDEMRTCVFRIIQEALNNCEKHASPTEVAIVVEQSEEALCIYIEDNGSGFLLSEKNTPAMQAGLGILGMRERAVLLGGSLKIESAPGLGTKLKFTLPLVKLGSTQEILRLPHASAALTA